VFTAVNTGVQNDVDYTARERGCSAHTIPEFMGCFHGPWTSLLDTREHGLSRSAGDIVNDVIIIFYLQDCNSTDHQQGRLTRAVFTGVQNDTRFYWPCSRPVNAACEHG